MRIWFADFEISSVHCEHQGSRDRLQSSNFAKRRLERTTSIWKTCLNLFKSPHAFCVLLTHRFMKEKKHDRNLPEPQRISEQLQFMLSERHLWAAHEHFQFTYKTTFLSALILKYSVLLHGSLSVHAVLSRLLGSSLCRTALCALLPCPRIFSHLYGALCSALKVHYGVFLNFSFDIEETC